MLADTRPAHRLSAAWVAGRTRAAPILPVLHRLAGTDPAAEVRRRARSAAMLVEHGDQSLVGARGNRRLENRTTELIAP